MRYAAIVVTAVGAVVFALAFLLVPLEDFRAIFLTLSVLCVALTAVGVWDMIQPNHSLKRNYPILANIRFFLEKIRPEIRQYLLAPAPLSRLRQMPKRAEVTCSWSVIFEKVAVHVEAVEHTLRNRLIAPRRQ